MHRLAAVLVLFLAPLAAAAQGVAPDAAVPAPIDPPPNAVFDLAVDTETNPPTEYSITLTWTAPCDVPGMIDICVPAAAYDLRWSAGGPIESEDAWNAATTAPESL